MQFNYFYGSQADQFSFVRIPRLLLIDPIFASLSIPAKLLYAVLLDRMMLSSKNGWLDENKRVYIIYQIGEIQEDLGFTKKKAMELLSELEQFGLVEKKRRGHGLPNLLYVKSFLVDKNTAQSENEEMSGRNASGNSVQEKNSQDFQNKRMSGRKISQDSESEGSRQDLQKTQTESRSEGNTIFSEKACKSENQGNTISAGKLCNSGSQGNTISAEKACGSRSAESEPSELSQTAVCRMNKFCPEAGTDVNMQENGRLSDSSNNAENTTAESGSSETAFRRDSEVQKTAHPDCSDSGGSESAHGMHSAPDMQETVHQGYAKMQKKRFPNRSGVRKPASHDNPEIQETAPHASTAEKESASLNILLGTQKAGYQNVLEVPESELLHVPEPEHLEFSKSEYLEVPESELLEVPKSAPLEVPKSAPLEVPKSAPQEVPKSAPLMSKTDMNYTYMNENKPYRILSAAAGSDTMRCDSHRMSRADAYRKVIRQNISYDDLMIAHGSDREQIDGIVDLIQETVLTQGEYILIASNQYPAELVRSKLLKLNYSHIEYVLHCLHTNPARIKNIRKYLLAMLFNAPSTIDGYYQAKVNQDMPFPVTQYRTDDANILQAAK